MSAFLTSSLSLYSEEIRIVAIGGGHGLGRVMSALSFLQERLAGIVTTTDNGGSTGRIRSQHGGIAWGDLRNCLNQIIVTPSPASQLFEYRFRGEGELSGHNLGNLMLYALEDLNIRPLQALDLIRKLLRVPSSIIPMSEEPVHLGTHLVDNSTVIGEVDVDALQELPKELFLEPQVSATPEALEAIQQAHVVLLGPGSFMTSIMPPLLIKSLANAIADSSAKVIFIDNLALEKSPVALLSLSERIKWIEEVIGAPCVDAVITTPENNTVTLQQNLRPGILAVSQSMNDDEIKYRHDRLSLCRGINKVLHQLATY